MIASTTLCLAGNIHTRTSTSFSGGGVFSCNLSHNIVKENVNMNENCLESISSLEGQPKHLREGVNGGKRVRFAATLVSDVWERPRTARCDVRRLHYGAEDFHKFRCEIRCDMMCLSGGVGSAAEFNVLTAAAAMVLSIILLLGNFMCSVEQRYRETILTSKPVVKGEKCMQFVQQPSIPNERNYPMHSFMVQET